MSPPKLRPTTSERGNRLTKNTALLGAGRLGSKLLVFFLVRFYTGVLTDAQYGTADLITNLANLLIPLACAGLSSGFFRFVAECGADYDRRVVFNSGLRLLLTTTLLFILLAPLLLLVDFFSSYVALLILFVIVANLHYFVTEYVRGMGNYRLFAVQGLLNTALNILFNVVFLLPPFSLGVTGYVLSIVFADLLATAYVVRKTRLWREIAWRDARWDLIRRMLRFCLPMIPATICWWVISVSDRYMVTYFCGEAANGLYTAAYKVPNLLTICGNVFIEAWQFSAVTENRKRTEAETAEQSRQRRHAVTTFFGRVFRGYSSLLFLAGGCMIMLSQLFAGILFAPSFYAAWTYIPILLCATVFSALASFVGSVYLVEGKANMSLVTTAIGALTNVLLNLLLIPSMGAMGAALATLVAYGVLLLIRLINARAYIPFRCQPTRQAVSVVLIILLALFVSPLLHSFAWGAVMLFLLVLNNAGVVWSALADRFLPKKNQNN